MWSMSHLEALCHKSIIMMATNIAKATIEDEHGLDT
jgi:hypothetical protein